LFVNLIVKYQSLIEDFTIAQIMTNYQTMIYKVIYLDSQFGWDYNGEILFESKIYNNPGDAMMEFSFAEPSYPNWFATMRSIKDGEITEEEIFDASVYEISEEGDIVG
jgi:hypothetical protein